MMEIDLQDDRRRPGHKTKRKKGENKDNSTTELRRQVSQITSRTSREAWYVANPQTGKMWPFGAGLRTHNPTPRLTIDLLTGNAMFMVVLSSYFCLRGPAIGYYLLEDGDIYAMIQKVNRHTVH